MIANSPAAPRARETISEPAATHFPADLSTWVDAPRLLALVKQAAADPADESPERIANLASSPIPNPTDDPDNSDDLLVLVAYCYLHGIFHSSDVIHRLDEDFDLGEIRDRRGFRPEDVRLLRRNRRRALTDCLARTLVGAWWEKVPLTAFTRPAADGIGSDVRHPERFQILAQDRIDRAVMFDSMSLDD